MDLAHRPTGAVRRALGREDHVATDHHPRKLPPVRGGRGHGAHFLSPSHHGDPVAQAHDLVQPVRDEKDRVPVVAQTPQLREELGHFLRRENGGGLVQDQDGDIAVQELEDLHFLARRDGNVPGQGVRVEVEPELLDLSADGAPRFLHVGPVEPSRRLLAQDDVLPDRVLRDQEDLLVDHADSACDGFRGLAEMHLSAVQEDPPAVPRDEAVEHLHERALAGAVLAHNGVDLPRCQRTTDTSSTATTFGG